MISDFIDRRYMIAVVMIMSLLFSIVLYQSELSYLQLILTIAMLGGFSFVLYPLAVSHANDFVDPSEAVGVSGGLLLVYSLGAVIEPVLVGGLMKMIGSSGLPIFLMIIMSVGIFFVLYRIVNGNVAMEHEKHQYSVIPRTSTVITELISDEDGNEALCD